MERGQVGDRIDHNISWQLLVSSDVSTIHSLKRMVHVCIVRF